MERAFIAAGLVSSRLNRCLGCQKVKSDVVIEINLGTLVQQGSFSASRHCKAASGPRDRVIVYQIDTCRKSQYELNHLKSNGAVRMARNSVPHEVILLLE